MATTEKVLLESYLKQLYLKSFLHNYEPLAEEAVQSNQSYVRYLMALAEQEVLQREANRRQRRLKEAKVPLVKELSTFDFSAIPQLNRQKVLQLAQGDYIDQVEPVILLGNPGLGKTQPA